MNPLPGVALLPACLTLGNLVCGLMATAAAAGVAPPFGDFPNAAAWLIVAAMILDGVDGAAARRLGVPTPFGVHLDSLADMISFGVAPAVLIVTTFGLLSILGWSTSIVYACGVALRLARFTSEPPAVEFCGMPCPAAALMIVGLALAGPFSGVRLFLAFIIPAALFSVMISRQAFPHPARLPRSGQHAAVAIAIVACVGLVYAYGFKVGMSRAILVAAGAYLVSPLLLRLLRR
ncbi:MAG: CDP-alcohol phosphatidyltransferase family protein [Planctomycetota bacterium]